MNARTDHLPPADHDAPAPVVPPEEAKASPYAWYALGILFLVYVLNFIDRQIITILAPDLKRDLGLSDADIGFLYGTAFAVFYALFGIPLGRLADEWKRVRLLSVGLALWSGMTALSGLAKTGTQLGLARMGVGVGEATASPSAYSLISDLFPRRLRGTALAIYSAGLYLGAGISLMIGGVIVERWNLAYPAGGPMGLVGWQAAFLAVGVPGLLLAAWVATLREPVRGAVDGIPTPPSPAPFRGFFDELYAVVPPLTLLSAGRRGAGALIANLAVAAALAAAAWLLAQWTGDALQWACVAFGYYAVYSWATSLRARDAETFAMIWRSPAFLATIVGYGTVAFVNYATSAFAPVYARSTLGEPAGAVGLWVGGTAAAAGFLGVILGGRMSDLLLKRFEAGRILVVLFGLLAPLPFAWAAFSTEAVAGSGDFTRFIILNAIATVLASSALGAAAATTQDLVLPRMRGTATATFFLATTLIGLALGPYIAGAVSKANGGDLSFGVRSTYAIVPLGLVALIMAWKLVPAALRRQAALARAA